MAAVSIPSIALASIAFIGLCLRASRMKLLHNKEALMIGGVCAVFIVSVLFSTNIDYWANRLYHSTAYLYIPLGVATFRPIDRRVLVTSVLIFIVGSFGSALVTATGYVLHFEEYNELYNVGKTIPTPIIHVRYSFLMALASLCGFGLYADGYFHRDRLGVLILAVSCLLFLFVHVLAVRTGLLSLYGGVAVLVSTLVYREKRWKLGLTALGIVVAIAVVSALTFPSLKNKINYMLYDLKMLDTEVNTEYSDNLRITSIRHGAELFLENPLFGVGIGDIRDEMYMMYETKTPEIVSDRRFNPISQIMFWLASFGIVGTSLIIGFLVYPLRRYGLESYLLVSVYGCAALSMLPETMFRAVETKALLLVIICLTYEYLKDKTTLQTAI